MGKYYMPARVFMGAGCIIENRKVLATLGRKALIVTGRGSAKKNGSEMDVRSALEAEGIAYVIYDKIMSNPDIACCYEGAAFARAQEADFIIAIGGGSPMDAGKAIALLAAQDIAEEDLFSGNYSDDILPMAFVPTTAGTGSEVTQYAILTNDKAQTKTSIASDLIFPTLAFLDPRYTEMLSLTTTINTAVDALSHAVEGMLSVRASVISDALAKESITLLMTGLRKLAELRKTGNADGIPFQIRESFLYASFLAGMVIAQTGTTVVHAMGYSLTYFLDIDHGRANGLLMEAYLNLVEAREPALAERILEALNTGTTESFGALMRDLLGDPGSLKVEEIKTFSRMAAATKNIGNCVVRPTEEDIRSMYGFSFED